MIEPKFNTFWPRFWAGCIDTLVIYPFISFIHNWLITLSLPIPLFILWSVFSNCSYVLYNVFLHGMYGQTLGKRLMKVIVLDVNENKISFRHAILRDIVSIVIIILAFIPEVPLILKGVDPIQQYSKGNLPWYYWAMTLSMFGWFMVELITMLSNNKRRALHDFIAGTIVIRKS